MRVEFERSDKEGRQRKREMRVLCLRHTIFRDVELWMASKLSVFCVLSVFMGF